MRKSALKNPLLGVLACAASMTAAHATEGGGLAIYPDGLENYLVGALPPPGVHALVYAGAARYDTLRGNSGQSLLQDFKVDVNVLAPRLIWVTPAQVFGGQLAFHAIAPCSTSTSAPTARASRPRGWATSRSVRPSGITSHRRSTM